MQYQIQHVFVVPPSSKLLETVDGKADYLRLYEKYFEKYGGVVGSGVAAEGRLSGGVDGSAAIRHSIGTSVLDGKFYECSGGVREVRDVDFDRKTSDNGNNVWIKEEGADVDSSGLAGDQLGGQQVVSAIAGGEVVSSVVRYVGRDTGVYDDVDATGSFGVDGRNGGESGISSGSRSEDREGSVGGQQSDSFVSGGQHTRSGGVRGPQYRKRCREREQRRRRDERRRLSECAGDSSSVPEWRRKTSGRVVEGFFSGLDSETRDDLVRSRAARLKIENELAVVRASEQLVKAKMNALVGSKREQLAELKAEQQIELLKSRDMTAAKKCQEVRMLRDAEVNKVQIEKAHATLRATGNVPMVGGTVHTVVSGTGETQLGSGSISPNSSVSAKEVHDMMKKLKDLELRDKERDMYERRMQEAAPEAFEAIYGHREKTYTTFTPDANGELPEWVWENRYDAHDFILEKSTGRYKRLSDIHTDPELAQLIDEDYGDYCYNK